MEEHEKMNDKQDNNFDIPDTWVDGIMYPLGFIIGVGLGIVLLTI